jgi:hypothetical protein
MAADPYQRFAILPIGAGPAPDDAIAVGSLDSMLQHALPQALGLKERERRLADAQTIHDFRVRADSAALEEREQEAVEAKRQADSIMADAVSRFAADVASLARRMDAFEQERRKQDLETEIAEADAALGDDGDLEIRYAKEKDGIEAHTAETGIAQNKDDDEEGGSPALPSNEPVLPPMGSKGGLPAALADSDMARFGRTFLTNRDRRAFRKAMRHGNHS